MVAGFHTGDKTRALSTRRDYGAARPAKYQLLTNNSFPFSFRLRRAAPSGLIAALRPRALEGRNPTSPLP